MLCAGGICTLGVCHDSGGTSVVVPRIQSVICDTLGTVDCYMKNGQCPLMCSQSPVF